MRNIDFMAGTYFSLHSLPDWMQTAKPGTLPGELWAGLKDHIAVDVDGNEASIWPGTRLYDFTDQTVRRIAISALTRYVDRNHLGWVFCDYASLRLPNAMLDLDRDGNGHWIDDDERAMVCEAFMAYLVEPHVAMPGVVLVVNGNLALRDDEFASLVDIPFIEDFPRYFFGDVGPNWDNAIDPDFEWSLYRLTQPRYRNGGDVVMIGNEYSEDFTELYRLFGDRVIICNTQRAGVLPPEVKRR